MPANDLLTMSDSTFCLSDRTNYKALEKTSVLRRNLDYITPSQGGSGPFQPGSRLIFNFSTKGFIDFDSLRFSGKIGFGANGVDVSANRWKFRHSFGSIIRRLVVRCGGVDVLDYPSYNIYDSFISNCINTRLHLTTQKSLLEGWTELDAWTTRWSGAPPLRTSTGAVATRPYEYMRQTPFNTTDIRYTETHHFNIGFFSILKYFPAHLVQNFQLELLLNATNDAMLFYVPGADPKRAELTNSLSDYSLSYPCLN